MTDEIDWPSRLAALKEVHGEAGRLLNRMAGDAETVRRVRLRLALASEECDRMIEEMGAKYR